MGEEERGKEGEADSLALCCSFLLCLNMYFFPIQKENRDLFDLPCSPETLKLFPTGPQNYQVSTEVEKTRGSLYFNSEPWRLLQGPRLFQREDWIYHLSDDTVICKCPWSLQQTSLSLEEAMGDWERAILLMQVRGSPCPLLGLDFAYRIKTRAERGVVPSY